MKNFIATKRRKRRKREKREKRKKRREVGGRHRLPPDRETGALPTGQLSTPHLQPTNQSMHMLLLGYKELYKGYI